MFGDVLMYRGNYPIPYLGRTTPRPHCDAGIVVTMIEVDGENRYAIVKHPNFMKYGFKLIT
jgi:hypothetical protein